MQQVAQEMDKEMKKEWIQSLRFSKQIKFSMYSLGLYMSQLLNSLNVLIMALPLTIGTF
jgi:hypothetical protein